MIWLKDPIFMIFWNCSYMSRNVNWPIYESTKLNDSRSKLRIYTFYWICSCCTYENIQTTDMLMLCKGPINQNRRMNIPTGFQGLLNTIVTYQIKSNQIKKFIEQKANKTEIIVHNKQSKKLSSEQRSWEKPGLCKSSTPNETCNR